MQVKAVLLRLDFLETEINRSSYSEFQFVAAKDKKWQVREFDPCVLCLFMENLSLGSPKKYLFIQSS